MLPAAMQFAEKFIAAVVPRPLSFQKAASKLT
jgi:hypothetical protein